MEIVGCPRVDVGVQEYWTRLTLREPLSIEVGKRRKVLFVESVCIQFENLPERGFWRWKTVTLFGHWGTGVSGMVCWEYADMEVPLWLVTLIYTHVPEFRKVKR